MMPNRCGLESVAQLAFHVRAERSRRNLLEGQRAERFTQGLAVYAVRALIGVRFLRHTRILQIAVHKLVVAPRKTLRC